ncbi:MAG: gamma-glutamyl-gamma-aminobutyrate hydrolase family protein [Kiritimatiellae bacterium]|nr:gamma-glutamyl-gamma-aminobutyrate hydrolase family protein [Kiritimatiellia bacterium]MDW8458940.1 gamma-glutamyl-gamma-aminobutyrate hydrolase family protein [Verrucomicrobiota bacterium]
MKWLLTYPEDGPSVARYKAFVEACGAEPHMIDSNYKHPGSLDEFAALLLPGGGDVEPSRYGDSWRHPTVYGVHPPRDELEIRLIREFLDMGRPIFGICRGIQILNVFFGGGLIQHVPDVVPTDVERHEKVESYDEVHALKADPSTRLGAAFADVVETNSAHHQAIDPDRLGSGLVVAAVSGAGIIEAVESVDPNLRISAVQWHPERLNPDHPAAARLVDHWRSYLID